MSKQQTVSPRSGQMEGGLSWSATEAAQPRLLVAGRMDRIALNTKMTAVALPEAMRERIEAIQGGGGINGALVGLIHFALDEIERQKLEVQINLG